MTCSASDVRASFAFAILSELVLFALFIFSSLYLVNKIPRSIYSIALFSSGPILFLFSIIQFGALGEDCIDEYNFVPDTTKQGIFAVHSAIRCILLSFFVLVLIFLNKFGFKGTWFLGEENSKGAGIETTTVPQGIAQGMPYAPPTGIAAGGQQVHAPVYATNTNAGVPVQGAQIGYAQGTVGTSTSGTLAQGQQVVVPVPQMVPQNVQAPTQ